MPIHKRAIAPGLAVIALAMVTARQLSAQQAAPDPAAAPAIPGQNLAGLRVYVRAGLKTHGPGLHDYPQFLADWSKVLTEHGAEVDGS